MKDKKALESSALVSKLTDSIQNQVHDLLADGVVTAGVVVGSVFFARDELFRVEELSVSAGANFVYRKINKIVSFRYVISGIYTG